MNFEEVKAFLESEAGKASEVMSYLQELVPITASSVESFTGTAEGKSWLDSLKDKHLQKGLETWKSNNLAGLIDAEIKKRFPEKDPKDLEVENLKNEISKMQTEKQRESLTNKAMKLASDKGLPLDLVGFFVGADEDITMDNLKSLETSFNASVQKGLEARLKTDGYVPPKGGADTKKLEDMDMGEYIKSRQKEGNV
ncbi:MAG: DUF4355 domain-containing protein [Clostridiales bacterium]|nr:DUF4355 domain-containing protein [Clostridiales bacterium]